MTPLPPGRRRLRLLLAAALAMVVAGGGQDAAAVPAKGGTPPSLRVLTDDSYPPYVFRDEDGDLQGILPDLWALWSERTGIPVTLLGMDWGEAQRRFAQGEADVLDTVFETPSRLAVWDFSAPYATIEVSVLFAADLSGISDAQSLRGFSVGVKDGDACIDFLAARGIDSVRRYESYASLVDAAAGGEVRVSCVDRPPATYLLVKKGLESRFRTSPPLYSGQFHWVVRKGELSTFALVERGFERITPEERKEVENRWMGRPLVAIIDEWSLREVAVVLLVAGAGGGLLLAWVWALRRQVRARTRELTDTLGLLARSEARFRTIFESISDAILILDATSGTILQSNPRARDLFGHAAPEESGLGFADLALGMAPFTPAQALDWLDRTAQEPQQFEWMARHRDGHSFWIEVDLRRARFDDETVPRVVMAARDITGRKEAEEKLTRTIDALTHSNTDLERFAYAASHDLREPLNTVVRYAQLLSTRYRGRLDSDADDFIDFVVGAAKQMMRLVEGLLEFSRVDSVGRGFDVVRADRALDLALGYLATSIAETKAEIVRHPLPVVAANEVQLVQLFQNLIGNALKYRDRDRPLRIEISASPVGAFWRFTVADNGIGIDPSYLDHIFVIFKRLHTQSAIPGVGIGLALCKRIVERHGGEISAESRPGAGARFHFTLSVPPPPPTPTPTPTPQD